MTTYRIICGESVRGEPYNYVPVTGRGERWQDATTADLEDCGLAETDDAAKLLEHAIATAPAWINPESIGVADVDFDD